MSEQVKTELTLAIGKLVDISLNSGVLTGEEVIDALRINLEAIEKTNSIILAIGDRLTKITGQERFTKEAQAVVIGESKGQA